MASMLSSWLAIWTLLLLLLASVVSAQPSSDAHFEAVPPLVLPALKPLPGRSFRGPIRDNNQIDGFEVTGQAARLPTSPDFLRLVSPIPLSHGSVFTSKPLDSKEWIVEVALRVHGSFRPGSMRGGRGLGFWYTSTGSPTKEKSTVPSMSIKDSEVSFFGQRTSFDGLGVIFDSSPSAPLLPRSTVDGWAFGADTTGVISAVMDDGKTGNGWFDTFKTGQKRESTQEAKYLERVVGECEAAFRNAPGLVWVRIAYFDKQLRVDLDLQPHTTLSDENRRFSHHCLTVKDISLPSGYYFGLSALASGNTEPDSIDIYAFDAWEVVGKGDGSGGSQVPPPVAKVSGTAPLAGTTDESGDPAMMLAEIISTQTRMVEAIDALTRRLDTLSGSVVSSSDGNMKRDDAGLSSQLNNIQASLGQLLSGPQQKSIQSIIDMITRLNADVQATNVRFDNFSARVNKNIGTITNRIGEVFTMTSRFAGEQDQGKGLTGNLKGLGQIVMYAAGGTVFVVLGLAANKWRLSRSGGGGRGKKMI